MTEVKKVRVCKKYSGFDVTELKGKVKAKDHTTGCIGKCAACFPELNGKVYRFLNGEFVICDTKEEFFEKIAAIVSFTLIPSKGLGEQGYIPSVPPFLLN